jgi:O-antigen/teichoic acid export membrane protein
MHLEIGRFLRQTTLYMAGNLLFRAASFILVPLYAHRLSAADYGRLELLTVTALIIESLLASGMSSAALRFYYESDSEEERKNVIGTTFLTALVFTAAAAALLSCFAAQMSTAVFGRADYAFPFRLTFINLVLAISNEISMAYIRARERPGLFIAVSIVQLIVQVAANVYTVVKLNMGVTGILMGNLAATMTVWAFLTGFTLWACGIRFERRLLKPILRYGNPIMISGLSASIFQSLDRYFLNAYTTLATIGAYALALRIANIPPMLLVTPFNNSYGPFRFSIMREPAAPQVYARILTYFLFAGTFAVLAIAALGEEVVRLMSAPEYWQAHRVLPLVLIPGVVKGVSYCLQTGIFIRKETKHIFYISLAAGAVNLALLAILVPRWGIYGGATAGVVASLYTMAHTWRASQKLFPVPYDYARCAKIVGVALVIGAAATNIHVARIGEAIAIKMALVGCYPVVVGLLGGYTRDELGKVRALLWNRWTKAAALRSAA